ncbi:MAG: acyl carrier protein [Rhodocyclaceae bacterium]
MDARQVIRNYILENFLFTDDPSVITDDASFLELGIIDSVGALEIALFIEEDFGVAVGDQEMLPKNLDSVNNLVAFVESKRKGIARVPGIIPATATLVAG